MNGVDTATRTPHPDEPSRVPDVETGTSQRTAPRRPGPAPQPIATRFWAKVDRSAGWFGCWPWTGALNTPSRKLTTQPAASRRPVFRWHGRAGEPSQVVYAARVALSLHDGVGLWERAGLEACHSCANPDGRCCNPLHLYWGTPEENRADRYGAAPPSAAARVAALRGTLL